MTKRRKYDPFLLKVYGLLVIGLLLTHCGPPQVIYDLGQPDLAPPEPVPELTDGTPAVRFIVFGDQGSGYPQQHAVMQAMRQIIQERGADFIVSVGDNIYPSGVRDVDDPKWLTRFEKMYDGPEFQLPFYMSLGNHDYRGNEQAQVEYSRVSRRWHMPARYYQVVRPIGRSHAAQFILLDTQAFKEDDVDTATQVDSVAAWLQRSTADWVFVAGHHPLYSNGSHGNNDFMIKTYENLFVDHEVAAYFAGHDHDLQVLEPVKGVHHFVSGAGGKARDVHWRENTRFAVTNGGFMWCRVTPDDFWLAVYDKEGTLLWSDEIKEKSPPE